MNLRFRSLENNVGSECSFKGGDDLEMIEDSFVINEDDMRRIKQFCLLDDDFMTKCYFYYGERCAWQRKICVSY